MIPGRFISIEGGEGCGKSTQARLLVEWLRERGLSAVLTREPGGTPGAEAIRQLLLHPLGDQQWTPEAEALLFAAARADHVSRLIEPALSDGCWVVCDRFVDSSLAYQGVAGGLGLEAIRALHRFGSAGRLPDRTILLQVDAEQTARRLRARDKGAGDAIGGRSSAYHARVAEAFAALAETEPERIVIVQADDSLEEVHKRVRRAIEPMLSGSTN